MFLIIQSQFLQYDSEVKNLKLDIKLIYVIKDIF